jgi:high-affinity nickel permease
MEAIDHLISGVAGGGLAVGLLVALLLGLRHATDPDHLTAVITLAAGEEPDGFRRAARLGLTWGAGHATTLLLLGLPVVAFHALIPPSVQTATDAAVGLVIVALAVRLLVRWRRGYFHSHWHSHGEVQHSHPHMHEHGAAHGHLPAHAHQHRQDLVRAPWLAYGVGALHGAGGSAGVAILVVASIRGGAAAALALLVFAAATAVSMALVSGGFAWGMSRRSAPVRSERLIPAIGLGGLIFGLSWLIAAV